MTSLIETRTQQALDLRKFWSIIKFPKIFLDHFSLQLLRLSIMESTPTKEYLWLVNHPEVEAKYLGEWIAVHKDHIVAHGKDLHEVLKKVTLLEPSPHITYVEEAGLAAYAL